MWTMYISCSNLYHNRYEVIVTLSVMVTVFSTAMWNDNTKCEIHKVYHFVFWKPYLAFAEHILPTEPDLLNSKTAFSHARDLSN